MILYLNCELKSFYSWEEIFSDMDIDFHKLTEIFTKIDREILKAQITIDIANDLDEDFKSRSIRFDLNSSKEGLTITVYTQKIVLDEYSMNKVIDLFENVYFSDENISERIRVSTIRVDHEDFCIALH